MTISSGSATPMMTTRKEGDDGLDVALARLEVAEERPEQDLRGEDDREGQHQAAADRCHPDAIGLVVDLAVPVEDGHVRYPDPRQNERRHRRPARERCCSAGTLSRDRPLWYRSMARIGLGRAGQCGGTFGPFAARSAAATVDTERSSGVPRRNMPHHRPVSIDHQADGSAPPSRPSCSRSRSCSPARRRQAPRAATAPRIRPACRTARSRPAVAPRRRTSRSRVTYSRQRRLRAVERRRRHLRGRARRNVGHLARTGRRGVTFSASRKLAPGSYAYSFSATSGNGGGQKTVILSSVSPGTHHGRPACDPQADTETDAEADTQADAQAGRHVEAQAERDEQAQAEADSATEHPVDGHAGLDARPHEDRNAGPDRRSDADTVGARHRPRSRTSRGGWPGWRIGRPTCPAARGLRQPIRRRALAAIRPPDGVLGDHRHRALRLPGVAPAASDGDGGRSRPDGPPPEAPAPTGQPALIAMAAAAAPEYAIRGAWHAPLAATVAPGGAQGLDTRHPRPRPDDVRGTGRCGHPACPGDLSAGAGVRPAG